MSVKQGCTNMEVGSSTGPPSAAIDIKLNTIMENL